MPKSTVTVHWPLVTDRGSSEETRHAWLHMACGAMAANSPLEVLRLESTASWNDIKYAYRTLAKQYHPDKCQDPEAKSIFQRLNKAYHVLMNQMWNDNDKQICDGDNLHDDEGNDTALQPSISMVQRENCFSVTIDILDMMFLVFVDECQRHHGVIPIDRGQHGLQLRSLTSVPMRKNTMVHCP